MMGMIGGTMRAINNKLQMTIGLTTVTGGGTMRAIDDKLQMTIGLMTAMGAMTAKDKGSTRGVTGAEVLAIEAAMVKFEAAVCMVLALTGTVQVGLLLAVWMTSELLTAAATIWETVERIVLSCSVLTKSVSLKRGTSVSGVIKIAMVGVKTVDIMLWIVGDCRIHRAASKIALIEYGCEG